MTRARPELKFLPVMTLQAGTEVPATQPNLKVRLYAFSCGPSRGLRPDVRSIDCSRPRDGQPSSPTPRLPLHRPAPLFPHREHVSSPARLRVRVLRGSGAGAP